MGLPQYSGPFAVGAIDLEIPVREPRSFGTEYVSNRVINKPKVRPKSHSPNHIARESHARAKKAAQNRTESGGPDLESDEAAHQHNDRSGSSSSGSNEIDDKQTDWNPFSEGAKTTTLHLSTVLFTLFYPTDESTKGCSDRKVAWMGRPKRKGIIAMLRYLGQYGPLAVPAAPTLLSLLSAKIPAIAGARLADPSSDKATAPPPKEAVEMGNFGNDPPSFPIVIFSHGLAGTRLSYSQFCGELASHGVIVAAIEHRDGSGIASTVRVLHSSSSMANEKRKDEVAKLKVPYFAFEKVGLRSFAEEPTEKEAGLRKAQLAMRSAEIKECLHVLREIQQGKGKSVAKSSTRGLSSKLGVKVARGKEKQAQSQLEADRLQMWEGKLDADFPALCGHSFGGATVIEMQRKGPIVTRQGEEENNDDNSNGDGKKGSNTSPFPFSIVLDPWVEPIEWRKDGEESDPRPMLRPAYVINSETFTIWKDHFGKLKRIMHDSRQAGLDQQGWLMTLCGCQHLDFSDLPFLLPHVFRSTVGPKATISIFSRATYAQMGLIRQRRRDHLSLPGAKSMNSSSPLHNDDSRRQSAIESTRDSAQGKLGSIGGQDDAKIGTKIQTSMESTQFRRGHFGQGQDDTGKPTQLDGETFNEKPQWSTSLHDSPLRRTSQDRERQMSSLKDKKGQAASKLWQGKRERDAAQERRKQQVMSERQRRGLVVTFANRTNSGNILIVDNNEEERIDFSERAADVAADEDASEVHKSLEDISASLDYKRPKIHSLMAFAFRLKGLKPGLAAPGKVLIHEY